MRFGSVDMVMGDLTSHYDVYPAVHYRDCMTLRLACRELALDEAQVLDRMRSKYPNIRHDSIVTMFWDSDGSIDSDEEE